VASTRTKSLSSQPLGHDKDFRCFALSRNENEDKGARIDVQ